MTTKNFDESACFSNGEPIKVGESQVTYKKLIVEALSARFPDDERQPSTELYKRGKLADLIEKGGDIDLESGQLSMLKEYVAKGWPPRVISAVHDKIEADYLK